MNVGAVSNRSPFHFSTSDLASSLSSVSSARSCSSPLPSEISSPRRASRSLCASGASSRAASDATRSRYAAASSPIREGLCIGAFERDPLRRRQQLLHVEQDHELLGHANDALDVLAGEPAKELRRRRHRARIESG